VAINETSYERGHNYLTLAADADARRVVFVTEGRDADTIAACRPPRVLTAVQPRRRSAAQNLALPIFTPSEILDFPLP